MRQKILVTGGLGFIGSHTVVELINAGYEPIIIDNLSNAEFFILDRIEQIVGARPAFYQIDAADRAALASIFEKEQNIAVVIHFAAYKAVGESVQFPLKYFRNNIDSLLTVLETMEQFGTKGMVFSSSATVYGQPEVLPATEDTPFQKALSAYGSTKQMGEEILEKVAAATQIKAVALRYFNPVGAHSSGLIGELPIGIPNNLMPYLTQAAMGKRKELTVFGNDYNTPDGTAIRDYIHVVDLAKAHVKACDFLLNGQGNEAHTVVNIGTGTGNSVLEVIGTFDRVNQVHVPYKIGPRRAGDSEQNYADAAKAAAVLGWKAELTLDDMVKDAWNWEKAISGG
ncbi:MAG: UDP-glucose 4-epimerase GalE [Edaphocola sp.]